MIIKSKFAFQRFGIEWLWGPFMTSLLYIGWGQKPLHADCSLDFLCIGENPEKLFIKA